MKDMENEAKRLLRRLGIDGTYLGFLFTSYGIAKVAEDAELLTHISKGLYVDVAVRFHVSPGSVERNIRTIKQLAGRRGAPELLQEIFRGAKPEDLSNTEFIRALADYLGLKEEENQ